MKSINNYISEKLTISSASHQETFDDAVEYLAFIVKQSKKDSKKDPDIWDDTGNWDARDCFEYWEGAWGERDDVVDFIDEYASDKLVAGWSSEESFDDVYNIIPQKLKIIMKKSKPKMPYKKRSNKFEIWEITDSGFDVSVMKFMNYANDSGTDYVEYWYMIAVEDQ